MLLLFLLIAGGCFIADVASKNVVARTLRLGEFQMEVIPGWFNIIYRVNQGGMWSWFREHGATANSTLAIFSCFAVLLILSFAYFGLKSGDWVLTTVLAAILGGALGNLHDRFVHQGVRDFLDFHYHEVYHYPTFNLADSFLVCGAIFLFFASLFGQRSSPAPLEAANPAPVTDST